MVEPLWKIVLKFLIKLKIELTYDPIIPLLHIYMKKNMVAKDAWTLLFITPLFTIAKTWNEHK